MSRNILVPLDGSSQAERALPYAEALARTTGADLLLVQAAWVGGLPEENWGAELQQAAQQSESYLAGVAARVSERGLAVETAVAYGEPASLILDEARVRATELIVMATHGRSGLDRFLYGSVAEAVLARSPVPVMLLRAWQPANDLPQIGDQPRLLVPLDGSAFAEAALPVAEQVAKNLGGQLVLLRAVHPPERAEHGAFDAHGRLIAAVDQEQDKLVADANGYLGQIADRLTIAPAAIQRTVRVSEPTQAITDAVRDHEVALVVMATHGRTGISRLILGSVAGAVLRHGTVPLLLVRPAGVSEQHADWEVETNAPTTTRRPVTMATRSMTDSQPREQQRQEWSLVLAEAELLPPPSGAALEPSDRSPVERLLEGFEAHAAAEAESISAYRRLAETTEDSTVKLLMRLVVEDEERHHGLLERMAASLRDDIYWTHSRNALHASPPDHEPATAELIAATRARLREEQEGIRQSRALARQQKGLYNGLFELLLDVIARDSEKHERILWFILRRLEARR